ncbi:MAG: hypothetical protein JWQ05_2022 [Methylobacterium sp.]|jgi:hypothetical protein|nr:hypothetical protein [Methylobacterium sp.]
MKHVQPLIASAFLLGAMGLSASAQTGLFPEGRSRGDTVVQNQPNTTGNDRDVIIARGATGADTITTDSAAGGNANLPERAVPNGSAGGGSSR